MTEMNENGPWRVVFDSHFHVNGSHDWSSALTEFVRAGGTAINLVNLPDYTVPADTYYRTIYDRTVKAGNSIRKEYHVHVIISLGPYPLDYFHFEKHGFDPQKEMTDGLELACRLISEHNADGFGEIGRPHFPTQESVLEFSNSFMRLTFERAKDLDTYAMLHTEDLDVKSLEEISEMARKSGLIEERVIKHHATQDVLQKGNLLSKTILATRSNTRFLASSSEKAMLESDFADDPEKPNKVIPADSVPRRALMIRNSFDNYETLMTEIFERLPYRAFRDEYFKI